MCFWKPLYWMDALKVRRLFGDSSKAMALCPRLAAAKLNSPTPAPTSRNTCTLQFLCSFTMYSLPYRCTASWDPKHGHRAPKLQLLPPENLTCARPGCLPGYQGEFDMSEGTRRLSTTASGHGDTCQLASTSCMDQPVALPMHVPHMCKQAAPKIVDQT